MYSNIRVPKDRIYLPTEVILLMAENLNPRDQSLLLRAVPGLTRPLTFRQTAIQYEERKTILHPLAEEAEDRRMQLLLAKKSAQAVERTDRHRCCRGYEPLVKLTVHGNDVEADSKNNDGQTSLS